MATEKGIGVPIMAKQQFTSFENKLMASKEDTWRHIFLERLIDAQKNGASVVVEPGCGKESRILLTAGFQDAKRLGLDVDPEAASNPDITEFVLGDVCDMPYESESADIIVTRWVLEHVNDPLKAASEFMRILRPGGRALVLVPNLLNPALLAAKFTPTSVHVAFRGLSLSQETADNAPTYYRINTPRSLLRTFNSAGFDTEFVKCVDQAYSYLRFSRILTFLGLLYGRATDPKPMRWLKGAIVAEFRKPKN